MSWSPYVSRPHIPCPRVPVSPHLTSLSPTSLSHSKSQPLCWVNLVWAQPKLGYNLNYVFCSLDNSLYLWLLQQDSKMNQISLWLRKGRQFSTGVEGGWFPLWFLHKDGWKHLNNFALSGNWTLYHHAANCQTLQDFNYNNEQYYLTIIRQRRSEYCRIIPGTKSRGLFDNIHWAWGI